MAQWGILVVHKAITPALRMAVRGNQWYSSTDRLESGESSGRDVEVMNHLHQSVRRQQLAQAASRSWYRTQLSCLGKAPVQDPLCVSCETLSAVEVFRIS